jgi:hypothetical protein
VTDLSVDERVEARERFSANIHHPDAIAEFGDPQEAYTPEECFDQGFVAAREYSKRREQETRLALDKVCALMAVLDCSECQGDGIDYEGDEWCVCDCVLSKQREEKLREAAQDLADATDILIPPFEPSDPKLRRILEARANVRAALAENGDTDG